MGLCVSEAKYRKNLLEKEQLDKENDIIKKEKEKLNNKKRKRKIR